VTRSEGERKKVKGTRLKVQGKNREEHENDDTNANALNILTLHVVIASPKGVAISVFRECFVAQLLAMTNFNAFILVPDREI